MLFVWMGFLKDGSKPVPQEVQRQVTEFLKQPYIPIRSVGALHDDEGHRAGMLMLFEVDSRAEAESLVENSPYLKAGLYKEHRLFEFQDQIG